MGAVELWAWVDVPLDPGCGLLHSLLGAAWLGFQPSWEIWEAGSTRVLPFLWLRYGSLLLGAVGAEAWEPLLLPVGMAFDSQGQKTGKRDWGSPLLACGPVPLTSVTESSDTLRCKSLRRQSGKPSTPGKRITPSKSSICRLGSKVLTSAVQKIPSQRLSSPEWSCD